MTDSITWSSDNKITQNIKTGITSAFLCYNSLRLAPLVYWTRELFQVKEDMHLDATQAINYGVDRVRFIHSAGEN